MSEASSKSDYRNEIYRNSHLVLKNYASGGYSQGTYVARPFRVTAEDSGLSANQPNSKLGEEDFLGGRLPPPMPPARALESYRCVDSRASSEMNSVKSLISGSGSGKADDSGQISSVWVGCESLFCLLYIGSSVFMSLIFLRERSKEKTLK